MPRIERWDNLPANVRQHMVDRLPDRAISLADLNQLRLWIESVAVGQAFLPVCLSQVIQWNNSFLSRPLQRGGRRQRCSHQQRWSASFPQRTTTKREPFTKASLDFSSSASINSPRSWPSAATCIASQKSRISSRAKAPSA